MFYETIVYSVLYHSYSLHREFHDERAKINYRDIMLNYQYIIARVL